MTVQHMKSLQSLAVAVIEQAAIGHYAIYIEEHRLQACCAAASQRVFLQDREIGGRGVWRHGLRDGRDRHQRILASSRS